MNMAKTKLYNLQGEVTGEIELSDAVFGLSVRPEIIHEVYTAQLANARVGLAHTKTRGEVRGGGKKPWRQKGTGRARHGSTRSPIWIGGGVTFGPRSDRDFTVKINRQVRQNALRMILSDRVRNGRFIVLDGLSIPESKTKELNKILTCLPSAGRPSLLVVDTKETAVRRASRNITGLLTTSPAALNVRDLLRHEFMIAPVEAVNKISTVYGRRQ